MVHTSYELAMSSAQSHNFAVLWIWVARRKMGFCINGNTILWTSQIECLSISREITLLNTADVLYRQHRLSF